MILHNIFYNRDVSLLQPSPIATLVSYQRPGIYVPTYKRMIMHTNHKRQIPECNNAVLVDVYAQNPRTSSLINTCILYVSKTRNDSINNTDFRLFTDRFHTHTWNYDIPNNRYNSLCSYTQLLAVHVIYYYK